MSFVDQALSNDVFISTIQPPQKKLGLRLTKLTVCVVAIFVVRSPTQGIPSGQSNGIALRQSCLSESRGGPHCGPEVVPSRNTDRSTIDSTLVWHFAE